MKDVLDKTKLYTFGIQSKTGKWHYLTERYKLAPIQLRQARYSDKKATEESASFVMQHIDSNIFIFDSACLFELTIKAIPFDLKSEMK
jgi:hypothetical protein